MASTSSDEENEQVVSNLRSIKQKISQISQKYSKKEPTLVAISKTKPSTMVMACYKDNHKHFGENYVQELVQKAELLPKDIQWHFVGHLQANKCKILLGISNLAMVETVDSLKLAKTLNKYSGELRLTPLPILLQVNTSGETSKSGVEVSKCVEIMGDIIKECTHLKMSGLMTIGNPEASEDQPDFKCLVDLRNQVCDKYSINPDDFGLSMGMSHDFEQAIQFGSTNVRVGSSIFGARESKKNSL